MSQPSVSKASPVIKDIKVILVVNAIVVLFMILSALVGLSIFHAAVGS